MLVRYVHGIIFLYLEILVWTQEDKGDAGGESVIHTLRGCVICVETLGCSFLLEREGLRKP